MMADHIAVDRSVIPAEIQIRHRNVAVQYFLCCPSALAVCSGRKARRHTSAGHRRKLPRLIDDAHDRVRKTAAGDAVQNHAANCKLAGIGFTLRLTLDNARQQFQVLR